MEGEKAIVEEKIEDKVEESKEETKEETKAEESKEETKTVEEVKKPIGEMSFEEKRKARAARFGIPVVEEQKKNQNKRGKKRNSHGGEKKSGDGNQKKGQKNDKGNKKQKRDTPKKDQKEQKGKANSTQKEAPLLPKEEIMARLKRAEKFNTGDTKQIDALKAMLRKHRFNGN